MKAIKALITGLLIALAVVFVVQNSHLMFQKITFRLNLLFVGFQTYPLPLYAYLLIAFLLGVLIAVSFYLLSYLGLQRSLKEKSREVRRLSHELGSPKAPTAPGTGQEEPEPGAKESSQG